MKIIQPLQLSLLTKNYVFNHKNYLSVSSILGFPLSGGRPLLEQDLWTKIGDELGNSILDMGMPKANGEVLAYGNFYAPNKKPISAGHAILRCGEVNKELSVIGNRYWRPLIGPSSPESFSQLPLSYEYAFGGDGYQKNTLGMGLVEVDVFGEQRLPLPRIESPNNLMSSKGDRPEPAGFAPLDIMWQQRMQWAGTYDQKWVEQHAPGYPLDINWNYFNCAAKDQWVKEFWNGDEFYHLENMHPDSQVLKGNLPSYRSRCFLSPKESEVGVINELDQRLETVIFFPEQDLGVLLWRGVTEVDEDDLSDMDALMCAFEHIDEPSKSLTYYQKAFTNRQDSALALKYVNFTGDIIPERVPCGFRYITFSEEDMAMPMLENSFAGAEQKRSEIVDMANLKKEEMKVKIENTPDMSPELKEEKLAEINKEVNFPEFVVPSNAERLKMLDEELEQEPVDFLQLEKDIKNKVQSGKEETKEKLNRLLDDMKSKGIEGEQLTAITEALESIDLPPELPRPSIDDLKAQLDGQLVDLENQKQRMLEAELEIPDIEIDLDELLVKLKEVELIQKEGYRLTAHVGEQGRHPHKKALFEVREDLLEAYKKGESLKGRDFACIDLSNQDLSGIDLEGAYLEQVNFSGAVLNNANFQKAIMAGSNFTGTIIQNSDLSEANLGRADFSNVSFESVNLEGAILDNSSFSKSSLIQCDLSRVTIIESKFDKVKFSQSKIDNFSFNEQDLSLCVFDGCSMGSVDFTKCKLDGASFIHSFLSKANFTTCTGNKVDFNNANLENARFHEECIFNGSNFYGAVLDKSVFQYASLEDACFNEVSFYMADFSHSNLKRASFNRAVGKKSQFVKSDLGSAKMTSMNMMEGSLLKARITSTDFSNSNLYAVEFLNSTLGETKFTGANLDMSKLEHWTP